jgi:hypothetical protein
MAYMARYLLTILVKLAGAGDNRGMKMKATFACNKKTAIAHIEMANVAISNSTNPLLDVPRGEVYLGMLEVDGDEIAFVKGHCHDVMSIIGAFANDGCDFLISAKTIGLIA